MLSDVTINHGLDRNVEDPWNMIVGVLCDWSQRWQFRTEVGFIGRTSLLLQGNYRSSGRLGSSLNEGPMAPCSA